MRDEIYLQHLAHLLSKQSVDWTSLKAGDDRAYEALADAVQTAVSELVAPLKSVKSAEELLKTTSIEEFFQKFLTHADRFTSVCCTNYATIIRTCALVPAVRGTPTSALAKEIRALVFEDLDGILIEYIQKLKQIGVNLTTVSAELRASSLIEAGMKGAAVGQLAGGFGDSGKILGTFNALLQAGAEAERKLVLSGQRAALLRQAENIALSKIANYLEQVTLLPERLLDFGCARAFGNGVSLERQSVALERVLEAIATELRPAVDVILGLPDAERKLEAESAIAEQSVEAKKYENDLSSVKSSLTIWIKFFVGFTIAVLVLFIVAQIIDHFFSGE